MLHPLTPHFQSKPLEVLFYKGHLTLPQAGVIRSEADLAGVLQKETLSAEGLAGLLATATGMFALAVAFNCKVYMACDIIRSIPLFVVRTGNETFLATHIDPEGPLKVSLQTNPDKLVEMLASGYVYGSATVYDNVYSVQAGELLTLCEEGESSQRYFHYRHHEEIHDVSNLETFAEELHRVLLSVFNRLLLQTPNVSRYVVALSGGRDSRMVVGYLSRLGVKNVVCFSYGIPENEQSESSRKVAQALGYEWHFVEYTPQKWQALHDNGTIDAYLSYAFNGECTPHLQDLLAVFELKEKGVVKPGDVLVTGHSFDFLTGSGVKQEDFLCKTPADAVHLVQQCHLHPAGRALLEKRIWQSYEQCGLEPEHFQEFFNWQGLQSKMYVGMTRTYGFFGFENRMPLWDKELVEFWLKAPRESKLGRKLLLEIESRGFHPEPIRHIPFARMAGTVPEHPLKVLLKKIMPAGLIVWLLRVFKFKPQTSEGLTQVYALKARNVHDLIAPLADWPVQTRPIIRPHLRRLSNQIGLHQLTALVTIRKKTLNNDNPRT